MAVVGGAVDKVDKASRSRIMSRIRSKGNVSTERRLRFAMVRAGIRGWLMHAKSVQGSPDFFFPSKGLAVFVDGCFWHGCLSCYRRPKSRRDYWDKKLLRNITRDRRVNETLRSRRISLLRIWEHEVLQDIPVTLQRIESALK